MSSLFKQHAVWIYLISFIYVAILKTGAESLGKEIDVGDSGLCPAENSKFPVYLHHPSNCSMFYICANGIPVLKRCEPGLHFNRKINACDYPKTSGCETDNPKGKLVDGEDSGRCPAENSNFPVYLHHPVDCNMFYVCANGVPVLKKCGPGLHFNRKINACDYPENAGCETGKPKGRLIDDKDSGRCPVENYEFPVYLHHPSNCNLFYICANGIPILKRCEPGLHFNRKIDACDYPQNAGCEIGYMAKPKGKINDIEDSGWCTAENSDFPALLRHPSDCSKFYICESGIPLLTRCPPGLHFNPEINACDYRQQVGCDKSMMQVYSTGVASPFCPLQDGKIEIFFRHPTNCSVFYMCSHGLAYEFICPAKLHFNLRKRLCDYEKNSHCQNMNS